MYSSSCLYLSIYLIYLVISLFGQLDQKASISLGVFSDGIRGKKCKLWDFNIKIFVLNDEKQCKV